VTEFETKGEQRVLKLVCPVIGVHGSVAGVHPDLQAPWLIYIPVSVVD
jgi:hypothetical protein